MRLLDLFCGAGGAAMGYHRAGFDVVGVDIKPQPNYPFEFHQGDAMTWSLQGYDLIHASPPCQRYSRATAWRGNRSSHPDLIAPTRNMLARTGTFYVVENVQDARGELRNPIMLCGTSLGLPIQRHRYFELSPGLSAFVYPCDHRPTDYSFDHGKKQPESVYRNAMGCNWMTVMESRQAIPPAYTEHLGMQLAIALREAA